MIEAITYAAWFALGAFFGIICTLAFVEYANARSLESICEDMEDDQWNS